MLGLVRGNTDLLFCKVDWRSVTEHQKSELLKEISSLREDRLLNTATDDLAAYLDQKYAIEVPVLHEDQISVDNRETRIDVSHDPLRFIHDRSRPFYVTGTQVEVEIPFSGDANIFRVQPTTFSLNPPRADVREASLIVTITGTNLNPERLRTEIDQTLQGIKEALERLRQSAGEFNNALAAQARQHIEQRKQKLLRDRELVTNLGFPLKARTNAVRTYAAPDVKKKIAPTLPKASTAPYKPEPALPEADYENILGVMERMVHVMECSPAAFGHMDEEGIRTHFLVQLNGQYEGQATGETFNYEGKTDILIKSNGRNIFVAECKFWKGAKKYGETIDQLLSYLSWRDTKAAVVVFNRNKNFSAVLEEIKKATPEHPNHKAFIRQCSESSWQYKFSHRDDPNREMIITVMAFDVPSPENTGPQVRRI